MAPRTLPQELLDQIVDHAWADGPSLRACRAAARELAPAARTHLFRSATLDGPAALARFHRCVLAPGPAGPAPYVRTLRVLAPAGHRSPDSPWLAGVPAALTALPALRALALESLSWAALQLAPTPARCAFFDAIGRLDCLALTNVHFPCSSHVQDLLAAAASLTELRCERVYWAPDRTPSFARPLGGPPPLRRLVMRPGSPTHLFTDWLLPPGRALPVQELDLHWCERELTPVLGDLLRAAGPHLHELALKLERAVGPFPRHLHAFDWPALSRALAHPRFQGVQVKFDVRLAGNDRELAQEIIYEALSDFRARGELLVVCQ